MPDNYATELCPEKLERSAPVVRVVFPKPLPTTLYITSQKTPHPPAFPAISGTNSEASKGFF